MREILNVGVDCVWLAAGLDGNISNGWMERTYSRRGGGPFVVLGEDAHIDTGQTGALVVVLVSVDNDVGFLQQQQ